jgi:hypothetical protein
LRVLMRLMDHLHVKNVTTNSSDMESVL